MRFLVSSSKYQVSRCIVFAFLGFGFIAPPGALPRVGEGGGVVVNGLDIKLDDGVGAAVF